MNKPTYRDKSIHIFGAGVSGTAAADYLIANGAKVTLVDIGFSEATREKFGKNSQIDLVSEEEYRLESPDDIIVSPGLKPTHPILSHYMSKGYRPKTEIDLAFEVHEGLRIGITGTNGKSTVTSLIALGLSRLGKRTVASGNIGLPVTKAILQQGKELNLSLELSSYQLEWSGNLELDAAVFTSFSPDHLDWHGTEKNYLRSKLKIFDSLKPGAPIVFPKDLLPLFQEETNSKHEIRLISTDSDSTSFSAWGLNTKHDRLNAMLSANLIAEILQITVDDALEPLGSFRGLPHRLEIVGFQNSQPIINDSKSTNLASTLVAIESIPGNTILLLGGRPKGESFSQIASYRDKVEHICAFGEAGDKIEMELANKIATMKFVTMKEAVHAALKLGAKTSATVLLSPGCASFDEYRNFEARGNEFRRLIDQELSQ